MKCKFNFGHRTVVIDHDKAVQIIELLEGSELYTMNYRSKENGGCTHHIYPSDEELDRTVNLELIPNKVYQMWKLAGKPEGR